MVIIWPGSSGLGYSITLFELSLDGTAGVWGVCGEIALPGEDDMEPETPLGSEFAAAVVVGLLVAAGGRCLLDEEAVDRCSKRDVVIESDKAVFASFIFWNLSNVAVVVLLLDAGSKVEPSGPLDNKSFRWSSILRNSEMLSSSVSTTGKTPEVESRCPVAIADDELMLAFPLELLSSSVLLPPPVERRPRLWLNELLYFEIGACFGEADIEEKTACSGKTCAERGRVDGFGILLGDGAAPRTFWVGLTLIFEGSLVDGLRGAPGPGEAESGGALNGW